MAVPGCYPICFIFRKEKGNYDEEHGEREVCLIGIVANDLFLENIPNLDIF